MTASESAALVICNQRGGEGPTISSGTRTTEEPPGTIEKKTHVDGASQKSSSLEGLLHDLEEVGRRFAQVVVLSDAPGEVFEAFGGGAARQRFVAAVDPASRRMG